MLDQALTAQVRGLCRQLGISVPVLFQALLFTYLYRLTSQHDLIIGTPLLNRLTPAEKNTIGMFVHNLPLRLYVDEAKPFGDFVHEVAKEARAVLKHQRYPYELLLRYVRQRHNLQSTLYSLVLSPINAALDSYNRQHVRARWLFPESQPEPLIIHLTDPASSDPAGEGRLMMHYDHRLDLYSPADIERLHQHLLNLLTDAAHHPEKRLYELKLLSEAEERQILYEFNQTSLDYPQKDKTVHQLFEEQVKRTPESPALVFRGESLTYRQLNARANQLARRLREKGVGPDDIVALILPRSLEIVIGMMGILKAGGAYLPIAFDYPLERIKYMLEDSRAKLIITQESLYRKIHQQIKPTGQSEAGLKGEVIFLDQDFFSENENEAADLPNQNQPKDLIYVIYTSGSTGRPKGVMIEHRGVSNYLQAVHPIQQAQAGQTLLSINSVSFDMFSMEILFSLCFGLRIILASEPEIQNPRLLAQLIEKYRPEIIVAVPSFASRFLDDKFWADQKEKTSQNLQDAGQPQIKTFYLGGEPVTVELINKLKQRFPGVKIINAYGPTEITMACTAKDISAGEPLIGRPLANYQIFILDQYQHPLPVGTAGEICVSGVGLARGYLRQPELTSQRFVPHPWVRGERIYKTGDRGRWLPSGEIEFLGRYDNQVKIHGQRVELGEIEHCLLGHEKIKEAVVAVEDDGRGQKQLCAYLVAEDGLKLAELKLFLGERLPRHMIPTRFCRLAKIPLTASGKIDRRALAQTAEAVEAETEYEAPQGGDEERLAAIFGEVLGLERVGARDSFFDLGGDSLRFMDLAARIYQEFGFGLGLQDFWAKPTVRDTARWLAQKKEREKKNIRPQDNISPQDQLQSGQDGGRRLREEEIDAGGGGRGKSCEVNSRSYFNPSYFDFFKMLSEPPARLIEEGKLPRLTSAALVYLPDELPAAVKDDLGDEPLLYGLIETGGWGQIGLVAVPVFARELYSHKERLINLCLKAVELAGYLGARVVSLTGLIPSATDYGRAVSGRLGERGLEVLVSTGHAATVAAVLLTLERLLQTSQRDLGLERLAVVGLGSIGAGVVRSLPLLFSPQPELIILCDLASRHEFLTKLRQELKDEGGFKGSIEIALADGPHLPDKVYQEATLVVGASNISGILRVAELRSGALIVDDSAPHCFSPQEAVARLIEKNDLLFTEGGVLESPRPLRRQVYLPAGSGLTVLTSFERHFFASSEITGCILLSLLSASYQDLPPTLGQPTGQECCRYYLKLKELGFRGAAAHLQNFVLPENSIERFRSIYNQQFLALGGGGRRKAG